LKTQIQIEEETRDRLLKKGKKGDTYDDVINNALNDLEKCEENED
jgi:hypothetical protein